LWATRKSIAPAGEEEQPGLAPEIQASPAGNSQPLGL